MKNATATIKLTKKWINRDHIHTFARLEIILITSFKVHEYSWALHFLLSPYYEHGRWDPSHRSEGKMVRQSSPTVRFWGKYISIHWHIYQEKSQILTLFKSFQGICCLVLLVFSSCLKFLPNFRDFFWATIHMLKSLVSVSGKQKILPSLINKKASIADTYYVRNTQWIIIKLQTDNFQKTQYIYIY